MPFTCVGASVGLSALPTLILAMLVSFPLPSDSARRLRAPVQLLEEPPDLLPHLGTAGEAAPAHPDQPDERMALRDRHDPVAVRAAHAVDQQGLDVGDERLEHRIGAL